MDMQHKSRECLKIMVFSCLFFILLFNSCWQRDPDFENQVWINNETKDSLYYQLTQKYLRENSFINPTDLPPGLKRIGGHYKYKSLEIIGREHDNPGDTVEIYRNGELLIKWAAPFRYMPDSVHHYFNVNSWEIKMGGHDNEWEIATFTITEDDFKQ
ncbi:MAG: hypothetical protein JW798_10905 [Prolixibacteraceae bacterium]|nr:hypothetical protein [Prolixibacteraceae bacterium]